MLSGSFAHCVWAERPFAPSYTGDTSELWLTLQSKSDLWHALKARGRRPKVQPPRKTAYLARPASSSHDDAIKIDSQIQRLFAEAAW